MDCATDSHDVRKAGGIDGDDRSTIMYTKGPSSITTEYRFPTESKATASPESR